MKTNPKILKLEEALAKANEAAQDVAHVDDGGTCNFDSVVIRLPRWREKDIHQVLEDTGFDIGDQLSGWFSGYRFVWFPYEGQANRRTMMAEAAKKSLQEDGYDVCMYYQMD